jgi:SPP1 family phage portal protein
MFYLNKDRELTTELLQKMINHFLINVEPKLQRYKNYYDGVQAIINKSYSDSTKPCNKTVINYCKNIVDSYCGYIATPGHISYRSNEDIEEIMQVLRYNDYQAQDSDFLLDALVFGTAAELMYIDNDSHTRFKLINPCSCFGVYDDSLSSDLMYFVRMYKESEWDDTDVYNVDVYNDSTIKHYKMSGKNGYVTFIDEEPHYFSQCPANIFMLPDEKSIFDCIMSVQDGLNELLSAEIDDFQMFCDALLALIGVDADSEDVVEMKKNRVLVLPEGASAQWITKSTNDTQIENILKRLHDSIYRIASCVDFSNETLMNGVASGISIQYKMCGQENRAAKIEAEMKKALQRRIEIISGIATLKLGEEVFRDIEIDFKRNIPSDVNTTVQLVNALKGTVSDATLLSQLDFVSDVNAELEAVQQQKMLNMELYTFGSTDTEEDEAV